MRFYQIVKTHSLISVHIQFVSQGYDNTPILKNQFLLENSAFFLSFWYDILIETDTPGGVSLRGRDSVELPKRNPNRIRGFDYSQNGAYFVTICTQNR